MAERENKQNRALGISLDGARACPSGTQSNTINPMVVLPAGCMCDPPHCCMAVEAGSGHHRALSAALTPS